MDYKAVIKKNELVSFPGTWMKVENYHLQKTNTGTESQTPYVLSHKRKLNNENTWTQGGEHHTLRPVMG